jgi:hypothetical protein
VEIGGIGTDGEEQLLCLLQLIRLLAVRLEAQVLQGGDEAVYKGIAKKV